MGIASGVEHDASRLLGAGLVNPIDQLALMVRLPEFDIELVVLGAVLAEPFHVLKGGMSIGLRLAGAEQIEVGTVEDVDGFRHGAAAATKECAALYGPH